MLSYFEDNKKIYPYWFLIHFPQVEDNFSKGWLEFYKCSVIVTQLSTEKVEANI